MKLLTLLAFFVFGSLFSQTKRDFSELPEIWPDTLSLKTDSLIFTPITAKEFIAIGNRPARNNKQQVPPAGIVKDSILRLTTKDFYYELPAAEGYESSWGYVEYIPELRAHLLSQCGDGACFSELVDHQTNENMVVPSSYDQGLKGLSVSPKGNYLLVYSSYGGADYGEYYNARAEFILYTIKKGEGLKGLSLHRVFNSVDWSIAEIVWDNDNTLALKVYTENGENLAYQYYKTVIK